jgi:hypothetical protein
MCTKMHICYLVVQFYNLLLIFIFSKKSFIYKKNPTCLVEMFN